MPACLKFHAWRKGNRYCSIRCRVIHPILQGSFVQARTTPRRTGQSGRQAPPFFYRRIGGKAPPPQVDFFASNAGVTNDNPSVANDTPSLREAETGQIGKCRHLVSLRFFSETPFSFLSECRGRYHSLCATKVRHGPGRLGQALFPSKKISTLQVVFLADVFAENLRCSHSPHLFPCGIKGETYRARPGDGIKKKSFRETEVDKRLTPDGSRFKNKFKINTIQI